MLLLVFISGKIYYVQPKFFIHVLSLNHFLKVFLEAMPNHYDLSILY